MVRSCNLWTGEQIFVLNLFKCFIIAARFNTFGNIKMRLHQGIQFQSNQIHKCVQFKTQMQIDQTSTVNHLHISQCRKQWVVYHTISHVYLIKRRSWHVFNTKHCRSINLLPKEKQIKMHNSYFAQTQTDFFM